MNNRLPWSLLVGSLVAVWGIPGCLYCCRKPCASALLPAPACAPCAGRVAPGFPAPSPPASPLVPQAPAPPPPVPAEVRSYAPPNVPPVSPSWQPAPQGPSVRLTIPQPASPEPTRESARLNPPETPPPPPARPAVVEERGLTPPLPAGIAQFSKATDQVASGLKPDLDGLNWLQRNGYRTVLHLHPQGEVAADRGQVEKRDMKYVSLTVSPDTLTSKVLDDFKRIVEDASGHPLFVYDEDGMLAGGLWYLYARTVVKDSDDAARTKAARLGLKAEHQAMWSALKKFLDSALDK